MNMKKILSSSVFIATFLLMLTCFSSCKQNPVPSKEYIDSVKNEITVFSKHLPIEAGLGLIITDIDYDDSSYTLEYKYQYTVPGISKPSESEINEGKKAAVAFLKSQPKEKNLIEKGFSFRYVYYSLEGEYLFTQEISAEDLSDN